MRWTTQAGMLLLCYVISVYTLDCRKFVFAPSCRGVSAKRSEPYAEELTRHNGMDNLEDLREGNTPTSEESYIRNLRVNSAGANRLMRQLLTSFAQYWTKNRMAEDKDY